MGGWAPFANLIPSLPDFAGKGLEWAVSSMARNRYASQVRHLRRREYQDMMFSMKQAGLNPILAAGASPGHSAAMMQQTGGGSGSAGVGSAIAANRQAGVAETKAPSEIGLNTARSGTEAEEALNKAVIRTNLALQPALTNASIAEIRARAEQARQGAISEATHRNLMEAQSSAARAAAAKAEREMPPEQGGAIQNPYQAGKRVGGQIAGDVSSTASQAAEVLRLWGNTMGTHVENWWEGNKRKIGESWTNPPNRYHSARDAQEQGQ